MLTNLPLPDFGCNRTLPQLETERIILRFAGPEDVAAIIHYYRENRQFLAPWEPQKPDDFYSQSYWQAEVCDRIQAFHTDRSVKFFLFEKNVPTVVVGSINFANIIRGAFQSCTLGYSLAAAKQGQGYMTEVLQPAIHYLFNTLNLHRISANYLPHNQRSARLLQQLGFKIEGHACNYLYIDEQWQDCVLASLTHPNWQPQNTHCKTPIALFEGHNKEHNEEHNNDCNRNPMVSRLGFR